MSKIPIQTDGSVGSDRLTIDTTQNGGKTFYTTTKNTMKRFPGMVPITAPWGVAGVKHIDPGAPFFSYAVKRCPGTNEGDACCLVLEGDGDIEMDGNQGGVSATDRLTQLRASTLKTFEDDPQTEYRARWNVLSSHTSFSRVVPDTGSFDTDDSNDSKMWFGSKRLPDNEAQNNVSSIFKRWFYDMRRGNSKLRNSKWGGGDCTGFSLEECDETLKVNLASPKCFWQRGYHGARERVAAMFLEHCGSPRITPGKTIPRQQNSSSNQDGPAIPHTS